MKPAGDACGMLRCPVWSRKDAARFSVFGTFAEAYGTELVKLLPSPPLPEAGEERVSGEITVRFPGSKQEKKKWEVESY